MLGRYFSSQSGSNTFIPVLPHRSKRKSRGVVPSSTQASQASSSTSGGLNMRFAPNSTPIRERSRSSRPRPECSTACIAETTPSSISRHITLTNFRCFLGIADFVTPSSNPGTSPPTLSGAAEASITSVTTSTPLRLAFSAARNGSTPMPSGLTTPTPVMTTRRRVGSVLIVGRSVGACRTGSIDAGRCRVNVGRGLKPPAVQEGGCGEAENPAGGHHEQADEQ